MKDTGITSENAALSFYGCVIDLELIGEGLIDKTEFSSLIAEAVKYAELLAERGEIEMISKYFTSTPEDAKTIIIDVLAEKGIVIPV